MIHFIANGRSAKASADEPVTARSVGIPVEVTLSPDFDGLECTLVVTCGKTSVDVPLMGRDVAVPTQVLAIVVLGSGTTGATLPDSFDDEMVTAVAEWLDAHPEATTTLGDGDVTTPKIANGAVTSDKIAGTVFSVLDESDIDALFT